MERGGRTENEGGKGRMVYSITPAPDGYVMLPDRTPHTQMMMSLNICSMVLYDLWPPCSSSITVYLCPPILLPSGLLPSELTTRRQSTPLADPCEACLSSTEL